MISLNHEDPSTPETSLSGEVLEAESYETVTNSVYKENDESVTSVYDEDNDPVAPVAEEELPSPAINNPDTLLELDDKESVTSVYEEKYKSVVSVYEDENIFHKEISYPADLALAPDLAEDPYFQEQQVSMKHVIHKPKIKIKDKDKKSKAVKPSQKTDIQDQPTKLTDTDTDSEGKTTVEDQVYKEQVDLAPYELFLENTTETVAKDVYQEKDQVRDIFPIKSKAKFFNAGFSAYSGADLLNFSCGNASIIVSPADTAPVKGKVEQNTIIYPEIYPDVDLRYTIELSRLKEELILKKPTVKNEYLFDLRVNNAIQESTTEGTIIFSDPQTGKKLFRFDKPFAVDSSGSRCDQVNLEANNNLLKLTIDPGWLKNAAYPVTIDPTITPLTVTFYKASTGFSGTQGPIWYYESYYNNSYHPMTWNGSNLWVGQNSNTRISSYWQRPYASELASRKWKAPNAGEVLIWGEIYNNYSSFHHVGVKITKNDTQIWPAAGWEQMDHYDQPSVNVNLTIPVAQGDDIRFVAGDGSDAIYWDPVITYNPNPA